MKKSFSAALILLALINVFIICATTVSFAADESNIVPAAPENIAAVNAATGVSVTWEQVDDTAGYRIYRCTNDGKYEQIGDVRGFAVNSFTDTTAVSGTEYTYSVKSYNAFNESEGSEGITVVYLKQPTLTKAGSACGGIELQWKKSNGADSYTVYRKNGKTDAVITELKGDSICSYLDKSVKDNKQYEYTVVARKGIHRSSFAYKTSSTYITAPTLEKTKVCNGYVRVFWNGTKTADKYRIYRKTADSSWTKLATVDKNSDCFEDYTVKNGKNYYYTVCSIDGEYMSGYDEKGIVAKYVSAPKNVALNNHYGNTICIRWDKVSGATEYIIYRKDTKNTDWIELGKTTSCRYEDGKITNGIKYTYCVKAKGANGGKSGYSAHVSLTALKQPTTLSAKSTYGGVSVSWTKMSSATGYRVYRKLQGESQWTLIKKVSGNSTTSYKDTDVKNGKTYAYTVRQIKGSEWGSFLKDGVKIKYISAPKLTAKHSPNGIVLNWSKSTAGTGYIVQRKAQGESKWKDLATISKLTTVTYTDKKPAYGKKNSYRIVVKEADTVSSTCSLYGIDPKKKMVALTYDDGPYTPVTNQILDVLEEYNGRATFFVVGSRVSTYKDCIIREAKLGCEIGNHTYNHTILTSASTSTIKSEISKTNEAVKNITGTSPKIVRAPGGAVNSTVKSNVNYPLFNWSVDTLDWKNRNSSSVVTNIKNNVRDGSIVLMHDLYGSTGDATETIVPWLVKNGYQLVTVSELMAVKGINVEKGNLYTCAY
ncbi:MAG: polysaccharide deacetylase family protein [Acutalibacteraceae bacterium]